MSMAWPDEAFWTTADIERAGKAGDWDRATTIAAFLGLRESARSELDKVQALIAAGWLPDLELFDHHPDADPWQWAWRRPSKREGKPGRRFASTGQAYNAMRKESDGN